MMRPVLNTPGYLPNGLAVTLVRWEEHEPRYMDDGFCEEEVDMVESGDTAIDENGMRWVVSERRRDPNGAMKARAEWLKKDIVGILDNDNKVHMDNDNSEIYLTWLDSEGQVTK